MADSFVRCFAKTRSGKPCQKPPLLGKVRCRLHGGLSPSGKDHWNYKHGECSKEVRELRRTQRAQVNMLEYLARSLGMLTE